MFKFFKKKKDKFTKTENEMISIMTAEEILQGIDLIKKRSRITKHCATFFNASISKKTCRKLKKKGYNVEIFDSSFKVTWN